MLESASCIGTRPAAPVGWRLELTDAAGESDPQSLHQAAWPDMFANLQTAYAELTHSESELERRAAEIEEARDLFQQVIESMSEALFVMDLTGRVVRANRAAGELLGGGVTELVGQRFDDVCPGGRIPSTPWRVQEHLGRGAPLTMDVEIQTRAGRTVPVSVSCGQVHDKRGKVTGVLIVARDVTDRKRSEEALRESEERTSLIVENALDAVVTIDAQGVITTWNAQAEATFGWALEEVLGKSLADLVVPQRHREAHDQGLRHFLATGEGPILNKRIEITAMHRDGHEFPVELAVSPVRSGETFTFSAFIRDITERKEAEEALARQAQELSRSNADLDQFAFIASHDLREPLRTMVGYIQRLEKRCKDQLDSVAGNYIERTIGGARLMYRLIDDLYTYSKVGRQENVGHTDCTMVFSAARANLRATLEESGATVTSGFLPTVIGVETELVRLIQNLVGNAIKFRGDEPVRVHVAAERRGNEWVFSVRDNGIGIEPEYHHEKIFGIGKRLHSRTKYAGTGFGLATCKKIVERHGGRIWVESELGEGSTFYFTLPAAT